MNGQSTTVGVFRPMRKCFSISGNFSPLLVLLLLVSQAVARPSEVEQEEQGEKLSDEVKSFEVVNAEYPDVDNVEFHHVKIVDGIMHEDQHPVIMYKEDFVNEDYVPTKNRTHTSPKDSNGASSRPTRKYKDIAHRRHKPNHTESIEQYNALKPEKIYFDVLPQAPVVVADDSSASDSKFDSSKIRVDVISLAEEDEEPSKQELIKKHPKKYHKRTRRDAGEQQEHSISKRNPYFRHYQSDANAVNNFVQQVLYRSFGINQVPRIDTRSHVPGKKWNGLDGPVKSSGVPFSIGVRAGEADNNPLIWGRRPQNSVGRPATTRRPAPPLFHNVGDEDLDFGFMTTSRPSTVTRRPAPPLIHNVGDEDVDFSFMTRRPPPARAPITTPRPRSTSGPQYDAPVSNCVWAIVQCCSSRDNEIRYSCFEANGCQGVFWGLNPCADNVRDSVVNDLGDRDYFG